MLLLLATILAATPDQPVDYLRQVKPILVARCYRCHSSLKQESGLRLDSVEAMLKGGEGGPAVLAGKSGESLLIQAVSHQNDLRMPPEGERASPAEIALLKKWVDEGAKGPAGAGTNEHWAFNAPVRPAVPRVANVAWSANPIDAFLAAEHERRKLAPLPAAPKNVLLRRVYLDLVGLPPTPDELRAFLADDSPEAYERVVDRLLASPRYGERWGRHWMDVWRYSDWDGYRDEVRESKPHIWRWRDWIVESLNADRGYNQMVMEMLAGDELAPADPNTVRATGYLVRNWYSFNRHVWLDNTVEHTGKAFLGLTFNCARCHDHMYDPLPQQAYYQMRAFFEPHNVRVDRVPGQSDPANDGLVRAFDADSKAATYLFVRGDEKQPHKENPLAAAMPAFLKGDVKIEPVTLPAAAYYPGLNRFVQDEAVAAAQAEIAKAEAGLKTATEALAGAKKKAEEAAGGTANASADGKIPAQASVDQATTALAIAEKAVATAQASLVTINARIAADHANYAEPAAANAKELSLAAGAAERELAARQTEQKLLEAEQKLAAAKSALSEQDAKSKQALAAAEKQLADATKARDTAAKALSQPNEKYTRFSAVHPTTSTGRRAALARWIAAESNPLTARVAVNHLWLRHFSAPLVPTVFDFGLNGKPPTHPELLDWLAVELVENGWQMKHLHRLIVTSRAYRIESSSRRADEPNRAFDPDNVWLWRMNPHRMEAEAVRDSALHAAGHLDLRMGGPELDPNTALAVPRRSLYFRNSKEKKVTFLALFDNPNVVECYRRTESVAPQQALAMANSTLTLEQARRLAGELSRAAQESNVAETDSTFITLAFERLLCRAPTAEERSECESFLAEQTRRFADLKSLSLFTAGAKSSVPAAADAHQRARENLVHVLFNHNDFLTVR